MQKRIRQGPSLFDVIDQRRSVRAFAGDPIDDRQLRQILEAANAAPSAGNLQAYEIHVVRKQELRRQLAAAALSQDFLAAAPVVLVFCANPRHNRARYGERGHDLYAVQDATIACTFAMLAATALGLATVWVGAFREDDVRRLVGASPHERPVALLPIGVAAEAPERSPRRALDQLVHEVWGRVGDPAVADGEPGAAGGARKTPELLGHRLRAIDLAHLPHVRTSGNVQGTIEADVNLDGSSVVGSVPRAKVIDERSKPALIEFEVESLEVALTGARIEGELRGRSASRSPRWACCARCRTGSSR